MYLETFFLKTLLFFWNQRIFYFLRSIFSSCKAFSNISTTVQSELLWSFVEEILCLHLFTCRNCSRGLTLREKRWIRNFWIYSRKRKAKLIVYKLTFSRKHSINYSKKFVVKKKVEWPIVLQRNIYDIKWT